MSENESTINPQDDQEEAAPQQGGSGQSHKPEPVSPGREFPDLNSDWEERGNEGIRNREHK